MRVTTVFPGRTDTPMQQKVHEHEKKVYDVEQLMRPETVARAILHVIDLPADSTNPGSNDQADAAQQPS